VDCHIRHDSNAPVYIRIEGEIATIQVDLALTVVRKQYPIDIKAPKGFIVLTRFRLLT